MADLQQTNISTTLTTDTLMDSSDAVMDLAGIDEGSRYLRNIEVITNTVGTSATTAWILANGAFPLAKTCKGKSLIQVYYHNPCRNDSRSWGGTYVEIQVQFNGGT